MLGRVLVPALLDAGHDVRVLSRRDRPRLPDGVSAVQGDVLSGAGLDAAMAGVDVVIHAATSPRRRVRATEVEGARQVLSASRAAGVSHVIYPSIVGVDRHPLGYYRAKWAAEQVFEAWEGPWTVARATQFHALLDEFLARVARLPVIPVPRGFAFQPVDATEYARALVDRVTAGPAGRVPDTGGPDVRLLIDLVHSWLTARGKRRAAVRVPVPGRIGRAFVVGVHTCPDRAVGTVTWEEYLARKAEQGHEHT